MSGFTPGPWFAERNTAYWEVRPVCDEWPRPAHMPYTVADVCASAPGAPDDGLQEANARLIAAAPELLEVVKDIVSDCEAAINPSLYALAVAALVKAEGAE